MRKQFATCKRLYLTYEGLKPFQVVASSQRFLTFVSYLWGIETAHMPRWCVQYPRLYLTYEGLKPPNPHRISFFRPVCILPMRDWNVFSPMTAYCSFLFVSYLWGIETGFLQGLYCHFCFVFVSYLWGIETRKATAESIERSEVCILPMRDWNFLGYRFVH